MKYFRDLFPCNINNVSDVLKNFENNFPVNENYVVYIEVNHWSL